VVFFFFFFFFFSLLFSTTVISQTIILQESVDGKSMSEDLHGPKDTNPRQSTKTNKEKSTTRRKYNKHKSAVENEDVASEDEPVNHTASNVQAIFVI
jgi:hypothetical protein